MFYKKIIGTLSLAIFAAGILSASYSMVSANVGSENNLNFDGVVIAASTDLITFSTPDSEMIHIDEHTDFVGGLNFKDIRKGDRLKINAKDTGSEIMAKTVKRIDCGSGYGR